MSSPVKFGVFQIPHRTHHKLKRFIYKLFFRKSFLRSLLLILTLVFSASLVLIQADLPLHENTKTMAKTIKTFNSYIADILLLRSRYDCPTKFEFVNISDLYICGDIRKAKYKLIYFTTMYYDASSMTFFYNTLRVLASMQRDYDVKVVLFIESMQEFTDNNQDVFITTACYLGWTVLLAPHCNEYGFPVFKSMFNVTMETWDAEWYGYSNGDMLFDGTLISTLDFIQSHDPVIRISMLVGRRYYLSVDSSTEILHYSQVKELHFKSQLDAGSRVDYFFFHNDSFPWSDVPDFVVGRPMYDTWLVWYALKSRLLAVDVTATVRAIHQQHSSTMDTEGSHRRHRVNDGMDHNYNIIYDIGKEDKDMRIEMRLGYPSCLPLKVIKMKRRDLHDMVSQGHTQIIGRGRNHHPIAADDLEYLSAIKFYNQTVVSGNKTISGNRTLSPSNQKAAGRHVAQGSSEKSGLNESSKSTPKADTMSGKSIVENNHLDFLPDYKALQALQAQKANKMPWYNIFYVADNIQNITDILKFVSNKTRTVKSTPGVHDETLKTSKNDKRLLERHSRSVSQNSSIVNSSLHSNQSQPTLPLRELLKRANQKAGYKDPGMIPFIADSDEYAFVLVRRTAYLEWRRFRPGFREESFKEKCSSKQNIDKEVSELVAF